MPKVHLSDLSIRALKATGKQQKYWCALTSNFGLLLSQAGGKSFFFMAPKTRRRIPLGKWPATPLKQARDAARRLLLDPQAASVSLSSFEDAFATYFERRVLPNYRERTAKQTRGIVDLHAARLFPQRLTAITPQELAAVLAAPTLTNGQANHLYGILRTFFKWALQQEMITRNPLTFPKPHKDKSRSRVLTDRELVAVHTAATKMAFPFGYIILLCIHCGFRKNEAANLKWSYITSEYITLPADVTKNGHEHIVPNLVGDTVFDQIAQTSEYVFPSAVGTPFTAWTNNKLQLDRLSGVYDWCIHDLRRTFSSKCAEWGVATPDIIERLLGHTTALSSIARVYNKWHYLPEMRVALQRYETRLARLLAAHQAIDNDGRHPIETSLHVRHFE